MNKIRKNVLKGKIKGLAAQSKQVRGQIKKAKTDNQLWLLSEIKKGVGWEARHHLLALAYLNGIYYRLLERSCRPGNKPDSVLILSIIKWHDQTYYTFNKDKEPTIEKINAWLNDTSIELPPLPAPRPKRPKEEIEVMLQARSTRCQGTEQ